MDAGLLTAHGAAAAGWTTFLPLTDRTYSPAVGVDLWAIGVTMATLSAIALAGPVLVTILRDRAPGVVDELMTHYTDVVRQHASRLAA